MAIVLKDFLSFSPSAGRAGGRSTDPDVREAATAGKGLKVTLEASHAGMVNGNKVMYSPGGMDRSATTWVWPQRRPVQVHHDDHADPIGRVVSAGYVGFADIPTLPVADSLRPLMDQLTSDNVVEAAKSLESTGVLKDQKWKGLGALRLVAVVTDSDAVEKILDGRYQGVSVTQRPVQAFCSICGHDWVADGPCEHPRGEKDEETGRTMYLIVGDTEYDEVSFVNRPADKHAMGISFQAIDDVSRGAMQEDGKTEESGILDRSMQTTVSFQLVDSLDEETAMDDKEGATSEPALEEVVEQDAASLPAENVDADAQDSEEVVQVPETDETPQGEQDSQEPEETQDPSDEVQSTESDEDQDPKLTVEQALKCLFEDQENLTGEMIELLNDELESIIELDEALTELCDAKLSTKKRKSLAGSTFCGPNRSFPVPDCAHVTAARRLIGRYEGPGSKESILACVSRKAKALGCGSSKSDSEPVSDAVQDTSAFVLADLSDGDLAKTLLDVEKLMHDRGLKAERRCEHCDDLSAQLDAVSEELPELRDTVTVLRSEYKTILGEHDASEDAHAKTLCEFEDTLRRFASCILSLTDRDRSGEDIQTSVDALTFAELRKIVEESDLSEVISFVRSGLSNEPTGTVTVSDAEPEAVAQVEVPRKLAQSLVNLQRKHGTDYATKCLVDWVSAGKLPEDFTLDKALELVAQ